MDAAPRTRDPERGGDPLPRACAQLTALVFGHRRAVLAVSAAGLVSLAVAAAGLRLAPDMAGPFQPMVDQLRASGLDESRLHAGVVPGAEHNERFWRGEFPAAIRFLYR